MGTPQSQHGGWQRSRPPGRLISPLDPVVCENLIVANSSRFSIVIAEQASESSSPFHGPLASVGVRRKRPEEAIAQPLVVPFAVVVFDVFGHENPKMLLPERNHPVQALRSNGSNEALGVDVQVRAPCGEAQDVGTGTIEQPSEGFGVQRIPVQNQITDAVEKSRLHICQVSANLLHPGLRGLAGDAPNVDVACREIEHEEHVVANQPEGRNGFDGEEVPGSDGPHARGEKRLQRRLSTSLGSGLEAVVEEDLLHGVPGDFVAQIVQGSADARVAQGGVAPRHATTSVAMDVLTAGLPGFRILLPPNFLATSDRYHRKSVSGVTMVPS